MAMPTNTATLLDWALWYAARGIPVFPLHTPTATGCSCRRACDSVGKHPRTPHGVDDATLDVQRITTWWRQWPQANIGLRMGVVCWALDVDPRKGGDDELYAWEHTYDPLPATPVSHTGGGGQHIFFALPSQGTLRNRVNLAPGIDIRGEGGYVVAPPSLHASGRQYIWDTAQDLEETPLAQAPGWLLALCQDSTASSPLAPDAPIPDGKRNDTLSRMAYAMRRAGMALTEILAGLDVVNLRCQPPLDQEELQLLVEGKRHIGPDPILHPSREAPESHERPALLEATVLLATQHRLPSWIIAGLLPEGLTIIGGLPKVAKSYLGYELVLACAGLGLGLGHFPVVRGRAAYLAIEDDAGDSKQRMLELRPGVTQIPDLYFLHGEAVPSISEGLVDYVRHVVTQHQLTMVVVDPLSYIYDPKLMKGPQDSFREAKDMLLPLRQLARELHFALVVIDHRRKQGKDDVDVFQTLYGSVAKYAVADVLIMVTKRGDATTLHCRGRKIKDQTLECTFHFEDGRAFWAVQGVHDAQGTGALRAKLLTAFKEGERITNQRAFKIRALIDLAELDQSQATYDAVRMTLLRMAKAGEVIRTEKGEYVCAGEDDSAGVPI